MPQYPTALNNLIQSLKRLPSVGQKSAERFAFNLIGWKDEDLQKLSTTLGSLKSDIQPCSECGCFLSDAICSFCEGSIRDKRSLCITSSVKDVYAIEDTHIFTGLYHVIPKLLSPLDGQFEEQINISLIQSRIEKWGCKEVIIALDSTLEGDATSLFIKSQLEKMNLLISRLALGLPLGSSLDFVDEGTLNRAFLGRQPLL